MTRLLISNRQISVRADEQLPLKFGPEDKWADAVNLSTGTGVASNSKKYFEKGYHLDPNLDQLTFNFLNNLAQPNNTEIYKKIAYSGFLDDRKFYNMNLRAMQIILNEDPVNFLREDLYKFAQITPRTAQRNQIVNSALEGLIENDIGSFFAVVGDEWYLKAQGIDLSKKLVDEARDKAFDIATNDPKEYFDHWLNMYSEMLYDITEDAADNLAAQDPEKYHKLLSDQWDEFQMYSRAFEIMCRRLAKINPKFFFIEIYKNKDEYINAEGGGLIIPKNAIVEAGKQIAEDPGLYIDMELDTIPELLEVSRKLGLSGRAIPEKLYNEGLRLYTDYAKDNFISISESQYQEEQRHPGVEGTRYDFTLNLPLKSKFRNIYEKIADDYGSILHAIGNNETKSFALVSFDFQNKVLLVEQIQSDFHGILASMREHNYIENARKAGISDEEYNEFVKQMTEHLALYPYLILKNLALFVDQNDEIDTIKLSTLNMTESLTGVLGDLEKRSGKGKRIYETVPKELGFDMERHESQGWNTYAGDMKELAKRADEGAKEAIKNLYERPSKKEKQISKRKEERKLNVESLRPSLQKLIGSSVEFLDWSGDIREFMKSVNDATTAKLITRKQQKQISGMINKYIKAFLDSLLVKVAKIYGMENTMVKTAEPKSKKSKAGVFITLPDDIAKQFPLLGAHDDSDPHITVLFIGVVPKKHEDLLAETVKKVAKECEPFVMKLDDKVTYFPPTKHSDGCKIAKMKIISEGLHELHRALKKAITNAGIEIDDHFSSYKPHTTLAYMQPPRKTYDREVPSGSWLAEEIHIWNGDDKKKIRLGNNKKANDMISVRAGVKSDKPAYKEKIKTDKGYVWKYDEKHIEKRWKVKKDKIKKLEKDIRKVREQYKKDLNSDDDRTRAIAAIVGIMDDTAMRIGNEESAKDGTFGASTLKVKHVKNNKGKITFDFPGKGAIEQNVILKNKEVIKTINDLMKGKKANDFIFEVDGKKIWDRAVNRYLDQFGISAKDLRGFHSNRLMKEMLKKKDWKDALKEVSEIVGHEATTLKNQYIDPDIVEKYENKQKKDKKSERIMILKAYDDQIEQSDIGGPELSSTQLEQYMPQNFDPGNQPNQPVNIYKNIGNIKSKVVDQKEQIKISPLIATAWNIIAPFMPSTVYLSSGFRSMRDQVNTIINYWNDKWGGYFAKNFPDRGKTVADMHKIINEYDPSIPGTPPGGPTREEATIAFPGKSLHQSGNALDISGVSANDITKIIEWINRHLGAYVSFNVLNEGDHVHVSIKKAIYPGPQNMMSVLREFYYGIKAPEITKTQKHQVYLSKRALNPQDETFVNRLEQKYFGANKPQISTKSKLTQLGIKSNVRLNETILAAWVLLKPYLPQNAVMTSGARTSQDQIRIINNYWTKSKLNEKYPNIIDPYDRSKLLIQNGWIVGPPTAKGKNIHLSGRAFDVSGSNLDEIASAARAVSNNPNIPVTFSQILIERKNNNVHIGIGNVSQLSKLIGKTASQSAISKIGAEENMKNQVQSIYEDLMKSNPPKEVADEFVRAFGLEINKNAKVKDDEDGKYEREKSDPKWKQILIDSDRKWTRKEIRDHYIKNADKIMREIKGKPIMIYVNTGKTNQNVLKRKHNEKPIVFNNTNDLKRWADRRLLSIHRVLGPKTTLGFVDLDVHDNFSDSKVKEYARKIAAKIKSKYGSTPIIYDSGGTGYHVEFKVKEMSIDTLRHELRELCEDLNEEFDGFTTGIVKGTGVRTDTTTLKNNGNLRVPWALHEKYGGVKKPIGKTAALSIRQKTAINVEDIGFGVEDEPGDYFEKSRMFLHRQPLEYDKHNAHKLAENDPAKFFYLGLHKSNPSLEAKALENMIKDNPKFYFIFNFDKREEPEFKRLKQKASEELAQQDPRSFFYYNLHHEMPELGRGAILHLIDKDPRSFGQLGLEKDYPDYAESATHAINIYDPTKTEVIDSKASVKLSKRATNEKVDVLYVVHPDAIIEQSTNVDYVNSYLSKVKQAISSHVGPVIVTSLGRKFGSNTEAGDIAKLFMKEISGDSDINVIYETGAERSMLGLKAGEKMLDDLYLNNALGTIKVGGCFTGSWCKMCVDDTIKQLTKQYGPDHVVFDNSITAAAGIVPKGKLFEPSEAPQENKQASVKLSKRDDNVYSFTEATDELIEKIENLPGYRFGGPVGFFGQLTFNASVEVQWMLGTHKPAGSLEGYTVEVVIIHSDSDKEHIKDSFSTYEKAYNYLSDTLRDVVSYYQRLEEEKGAEIIPFPKMSSLISKRAEYGPDYGWKKWVQNYSNIPGQKNEKLSSRTLMSKKAFGPTVIAPMRLKKIKDPSELLDKYKKEELSIQHKFDGWKTQAIKDSKGAVKLYTRKGSGFEANVPELVKELEKKLDSGDFVLGELTFEKNGVQSISDVQTIAGSSPEKAQEHLKKTKGHLVFQAYDLLWNNGHDITKESYIERYNKLKKQIGESSIIKVPKNYSWDEFDIAMRNAQKEGSEGVVIKTKDSKYNYGPKGANEKTGDWYKYKIKGKKAQTDEVILNKYEHGKEKLKFPAYQYKDGKLFEVGVLSGLPKDKEKEIKNKIDNGKSVVVEVTYQEIMPSGKFRHMGWGGRERPDKPLKEVKVNK